jgi:DNA modification methylase
MQKYNDGQMNKPQPKLEQMHPADLIPYARNAKKHDPEQVVKIAGSIREFGFNNPVLVDQDNGIIAGHGRVMAAIKLGLESVPIIRLSHLTETQRRAYILADNKLAELGGGWDEEMLKVELEAIKESDLDHLLTGFSDEEMAELLAETNQLNGDPDEVPETPDDPITKPGDMWILGEHRLLCGDSTKAEDVERLMAGAKADACVTDPPYGIGVDAAMHKQSGTQYGKAAAAKRHYAATDWDKLPPQSVIDNAASHSEAIIFGGNYFKLPPARCWLVWDKENGDNAFADCELAWTNLDKPVRLKRHLWNGMIRKGREERTIHPTQKPVDVMAWCIGMTAGVVYDPFLGSGTTLIAAEQLGRKCYGMEISPSYCDVIVKRWETLTGKKATRESDVL